MGDAIFAKDRRSRPANYTETCGEIYKDRITFSILLQDILLHQFSSAHLQLCVESGVLSRLSQVPGGWHCIKSGEGDVRCWLRAVPEFVVPTSRHLNYWHSQRRRSGERDSCCVTTLLTSIAPVA